MDVPHGFPELNSGGFWDLGYEPGVLCLFHVFVEDLLGWWGGASDLHYFFTQYIFGFHYPLAEEILWKSFKESFAELVLVGIFPDITEKAY